MSLDEMASEIVEWHDREWPSPDGTPAEDYLPCDACGCEESCPPVPVAAAPVGTITTWEAT